MLAELRDRRARAAPVTAFVTRFGGPTLTVVTILAVHAVSVSVAEIPNPAPIYLVAVVYAAYSGGLVHGLVSAAMVIAYSVIDLSLPGQPFRYTPETSTIAAVLTVTCPAIAILVGVLRTREREELHELEEAGERLRALDRAKSDFLSTISHELRLPLTALRWTAESLASSEERGLSDDVSRADGIRRIAAGVDELGNLVDQLLDFGRIEHGLISVSLREVDVRAEIQRTIDRMHGALAEHEVEIWAPLDVRANADANALHRILSNLLSNAVKFSPPGSLIAVAVRTEGGRVSISVIDQGIGIAPEDLERIFERFYRAPGAAQSARGMGIGLDVALRFAQAMGAELTVSSEPGRGAAFTLLLPAPHDGTASVSGQRQLRLQS